MWTQEQWAATRAATRLCQRSCKLILRSISLPRASLVAIHLAGIQSFFKRIVCHLNIAVTLSSIIYL